MPRPKSTPKLLQRKSPSTGRLLAYAKFDGKTVTFGPMGTRARCEFERILARWIANGRRLDGPEAREDTTTVTELGDRYVAHAKIYYRHLADGSPTASVTRIRTAIEKLKEDFGAMRARDFDLQALKVYRDQLVAGGLSRVTVNGKIQAVKAAFAWAAEEKLVPPEVAARLKVLRQLQRGRSLARELPPREPVDWATVEATLPHLPKPVQGIVKLMWWTAMRVGEACQVRGRDLDRSGPVWVFRPVRHKLLHHRKAREIDIGSKAQEVLAEFAKFDPDEYWFSPEAAVTEHFAARREARKTKLWDSHEAHILSKRAVDPKRRPGLVYTPRTVAKAIQRAIARVNRALAKGHCDSQAEGPPPRIPNWSTHQLRHARLSIIRRQFGAEAALAVGGHGSFAMTEVYTGSARRQLARDVAAKSG